MKWMSQMHPARQPSSLLPKSPFLLSTLYVGSCELVNRAECVPFCFLSCEFFFVFDIIRDGRLLIDELSVRCILEISKRYSFAIFEKFSQTLTFWLFPNSFPNFFVFEFLKIYFFRTSLLFSELFPKP